METEKKVYCQGSKELARVLEEIKKSKKIKHLPSVELWDTSSNFFAQSSFDKDTIGFTSSSNWFKDLGYTKVTPDVFSKVWLGYNCLLDKKKVFCVGSKDLLKVLKEIAKRPSITLGIPNDYYCTQPDHVVGYYGGTFQLSSFRTTFSKMDYIEVTPRELSLMWLGYDCTLEETKKEIKKEESNHLDKYKIYCRGSEKLSQVLSAIELKMLVDIRGEGHWTDSRYSFAYDQDYPLETRICYSSTNPAWFAKDWGYKEVTPEEFSIAWLGYNCLEESKKPGKLSSAYKEEYEKCIEALKEEPDTKVVEPTNIKVKPLKIIL